MLIDPKDPAFRRRALVENSVSRVLAEADHFMSLTLRARVTQAAIAAADGDGSWCRACGCSSENRCRENCGPSIVRASNGSLCAACVWQIAHHAFEQGIYEPGVPAYACPVCRGCTDEKRCQPGCDWVYSEFGEITVCSLCASYIAEAAITGGTYVPGNMIVRVDDEPLDIDNGRLTTSDYPLRPTDHLIVPFSWLGPRIDWIHDQRIYDLTRTYLDRAGDRWRATGWLLSGSSNPQPFMTLDRPLAFSDRLDATYAAGVPMSVLVQRRGPLTAIVGAQPSDKAVHPC